VQQLKIFMSNLQIGLAILGILILMGLLLYNSWNSKKIAPRQAEPYLSQQELDALNPQSPYADPLGHEPTDFQDEILLAQKPLSKSSEHSQTSGLPEMTGSSAHPKPHRPLLMDALVDVTSLIELDGPVRGDQAIQALPASRRVGTKFFAVEGLNAESGEWEPLYSGQRYSAFQSGVQLANRGGPLNEIEFSEFLMKTQAFADHFNATPEFPDMIEVISHARELDQFATEHDAQLSFTIRAQESAWSPGYVHQHASHLGFIPGSVAGRMVIASNTLGNPALLSLTYDSRAALADDPSQAAVTSISLLLDVTHVPQELAPFALMCKIAQQLALEMDGIITDDNNQILDERSMQIIQRDLDQLYKALQQRDLSAGSPQARRLFS
jgi:hypothetical protein